MIRVEKEVNFLLSARRWQTFISEFLFIITAILFRFDINSIDFYLDVSVFTYFAIMNENCVDSAKFWHLKINKNTKVL